MTKPGKKTKSLSPERSGKVPAKVRIHALPTGVRGLDEILGGGFPEFSFNLIGGSPGCGKTTLVHQFAFANGTPERPALYFTVLGEPVIKMLRYQQQFSFFDESKVGAGVRFINLSDLGCELINRHVRDCAGSPHWSHSERASQAAATPTL